MRALDPGTFAALDHSRVLTVDGASGSGKTSLLRRLAARYDVSILELGVLVRNVAAWADRKRVSAADAAAHFARLSQQGLLLVDNAPADAPVASVFSVSGEKIAAVDRAWSRALAATSLDDSAMSLIDRTVAELISASAVAVSGRTVGLTVCPAAPLRVRLHARPAVRAERKRRQLGPHEAWQDDARLLPPCAPGHIEIDTSDVDENYVADLVGVEAERRLGWRRRPELAAEDLRLRRAK
jgi:cytidylate kinase